MALNKTFQTKMGVSGEYIKIQPSFKDKTNIILKMEYWKDKTIRNVSGNYPLNDQITGSSNDRIVGFKCLYEFDYDLNSTDNIYVQAYDYLKTLPEFINAENC